MTEKETPKRRKAFEIIPREDKEKVFSLYLQDYDLSPVQLIRELSQATNIPATTINTWIQEEGWDEIKHEENNRALQKIQQDCRSLVFGTRLDALKRHVTILEGIEINVQDAMMDKKGNLKTGLNLSVLKDMAKIMREVAQISINLSKFYDPEVAHTRSVTMRAMPVPTQAVKIIDGKESRPIYDMFETQKRETSQEQSPEAPAS